MAAASTEYIDVTTAAAVEEKAKLQKHFSRFDIFFFLICTLVGLDTLGAVSSDGAQAFTWLAFLGAFFFLPYALLTAELGSTFTEEGGAYIWVKLAFGRFVAAIDAILYWLSNPIWLGGSLTILAVTTFSDFFTPLNGIWKYLFALGFIWFAVWAAILSFGIGKWIPTIGAWVRIGVLGIFVLTVILYAIDHGSHLDGGCGVGPGAGCALLIRRPCCIEPPRDQRPASGNASTDLLVPVVPFLQQAVGLDLGVSEPLRGRGAEAGDVNDVRHDGGVRGRRG